jgi:hypothetical protein
MSGRQKQLAAKLVESFRLLTPHCQPLTTGHSPALLDADWVPGRGAPMTNLWQVFEVPSTNPAQFFRAVRP